MAAHGVGQNPIFQHLQKDGSHIPVGFFQFVQKHHAVRSAANFFRQFPAFTVTHIAGRRTQQPRDRVLLHILRHIQPYQRIPAAVHAVGQGFAQRGFPHTRRAKEEKGCHRSATVRQSQPSPAHRFRHGLCRLCLTQNLLFQLRLQVQQPLPVGFGHTSHRNACASCHHSRHILPLHRQFLQSSFLLLQKLLQLIPDGSRRFKPIVSNSFREFASQFLPMFLCRLTALVPIFGLRCRFIQQIHRLIRQKMRRQISAAQLHRRLHGLPGDADAVMVFQPRAQAFQHLQRFGFGRLPNGHRPKPPLQSRIFFDVFSVFFQRSGTDQLDLATSQCRF